MPFESEMAEIFSLYTHHMQLLSFRQSVTGLRYFRNHNYSMVFNEMLVLKDIVFSQAAARARKLLGNKIVDLLID